jgi:hypothetical protein
MPRLRKKSPRTKAPRTNAREKTKVYLLWFIHEPEDGQHIECFIGVYASRPEAKAAIARLRGEPGFAEYPQGFQICPYELGKDHWTKGFKQLANS